jgi:hypothetical protein
METTTFATRQQILKIDLFLCAILLFIILLSGAILTLAKENELLMKLSYSHQQQIHELRQEIKTIKRQSHEKD